MSPRGRGPGLWIVLGGALALRLLRAGLRWDEIALAYAAYQQPWIDAWASGSPGAILGTFVGLHPPLYSALYAVVDAAWGAPAGWLGLSVLCSWGAVALVGRQFGIAAAAVLAIDPLQLAYCAEINNYPLLCLATAACLAARERAASGRGALAMGAAGALAGWTHLLGGVVGGLCALSLLRRDPRAAATALAVMALGCAPVIARGLALSGADGTFGQAGLQLDVLGPGLWEKQGPWIAAWALALLGARRRPAAALTLAGGAAAIGVMVALGVAAPHQHPYWLLLGPPAAIGLASLGRGVLAWGAVALGLAGLRPDLERLQRLERDLARPRAIDSALAMSAPGDAIWLLAPALQPDDDKTATSDVLWRLGPFDPAPAWRGPDEDAPAFEYTDYGFGQPRTIRGRVVHTTTDVWPPQHDAALGWHLAAGRTIWFVLYDHGPARDYDGKLLRALSPYEHTCNAIGADAGLGVDLLCEVTGLR